MIYPVFIAALVLIFLTIPAPWSTMYIQSALFSVVVISIINLATCKLSSISVTMGESLRAAIMAVLAVAAIILLNAQLGLGKSQAGTIIRYLCEIAAGGFVMWRALAIAWQPVAITVSLSAAIIYSALWFYFKIPVL
ncbi:hypothetical protein [Undibacterium sp.]|uniref:hypothetical protein n=1 Tax=Undibacterium sp. TaxID=1914977 RepID=UPI00375379CD